MVFSGPNVCGYSSIQKFCLTLCPSSLVIHTHLLFTNDAIYAVGAAKSFASYTLHVAVLSPTTGELLASANLPSSIANPLREIMVLTCNDTDSTHAIWLENGLVKSLVLTPKLSNKPSTIEGAGYAQILDVGLSKYGQLVATREDGASRILKLDEDGLSLASIWQFENSVCNVSSSLPCLLHSLLHDV
jgi:hypothetical protein